MLDLKTGAGARKRCILSNITGSFSGASDVAAAAEIGGQGELSGFGNVATSRPRCHATDVA